MKKKMTLKECKEECIKMWRRLAESGEGYKPQSNFLNACACCQYTLENSKDLKDKDCTICPIEWISKEKYFDNDTPCLCSPSPYFSWYLTKSKSRKKVYAQEIVKLAEQIQIEDEEI